MRNVKKPAWGYAKKDINTMIRPRQQPISVATESWWVSQSRESFQVKAHAEQERMKSSSFGRARWENSPEY